MNLQKSEHSAAEAQSTSMNQVTTRRSSAASSRASALRLGGSVFNPVLISTACVIGVGMMGGCRGERSDSRPRQFFPDMDDQARWDPQEESKFFEDGRTMRNPVAGTVAFARSPLDPAGAGNAQWATTFRIERANFLREDEATYYGGPLNEVGGVTQYVETIPMPVTMAMLERGRERFNIYCSVCHGYTGDGLGEVGKQWSYAVPSFHDPKYTTPDATTQLWRDGYLFHVSRNGVIDAAGAEKMPPYAHALSVQDSWAIVAYIRALQRSRSGDINDVPPASREMLEQQRPAASANENSPVTTIGSVGGSTGATTGTGGGL